MRRPASGSVPFLFSLYKGHHHGSKSFIFYLRILFSWLQTPGKRDIPILWPLLSPLNVNREAFRSNQLQLHYCPVRQQGDLFLTPSLSFLLSGHMGQIKGAFSFSAAGLNHQAVGNTEQIGSVGRVSPDEAWETFLITCVNISMKHPLWSFLFNLGEQDGNEEHLFCDFPHSYPSFIAWVINLTHMCHRNAFKLFEQSFGSSKAVQFNSTFTCTLYNQVKYA